jgi:fructose-specific phosphotransferase system IIC component
MNPGYATLPFVIFSGVMLALGFWIVRADRKEEAAKRAAGFATSGPESRSQSAE